MTTPAHRQDAALRLMAAGGRLSESLLQNNAGIVYATKRLAAEMKATAAAWEIDVNWTLPKIKSGHRASLFDAVACVAQNTCEILNHTARADSYDYTAEALSGTRKRVQSALQHALTNLSVICTQLKITAVFEAVGQMQIQF